jgi:hypothetical protein
MHANTDAGDIDFMLVPEDAADGRSFETNPRSPCGTIDDDDDKIVANIGPDDMAGNIRWQYRLNLPRECITGSCTFDQVGK